MFLVASCAPRAVPEESLAVVEARREHGRGNDVAKAYAEMEARVYGNTEADEDVDDVDDEDAPPATKPPPGTTPAAPSAPTPSTPTPQAAERCTAYWTQLAKFRPDIIPADADKLERCRFIKHAVERCEMRAATIDDYNACHKRATRADCEAVKSNMVARYGADAFNPKLQNELMNLCRGTFRRSHIECITVPEESYKTCMSTLVD